VLDVAWFGPVDSQLAGQYRKTVSNEFIVMPGDASPILEAARTALDGPRKLSCRAECFLQFDSLAMNRLDSGVFEEAAKSGREVRRSRQHGRPSGECRGRGPEGGATDRGTAGGSRRGAAAADPWLAGRDHEADYRGGRDPGKASLTEARAAFEQSLNRKRRARRKVRRHNRPRSFLLRADSVTRHGVRASRASRSRIEKVRLFCPLSVQRNIIPLLQISYILAELDMLSL
jgi:hypothetical protein